MQRGLLIVPSFPRVAGFLRRVRRCAWALLLAAGLVLPAAAAKQRVTGEQLEQIVAAARGEPDAAVARQLFDLEPVERLSAARLARCEASVPGPHARQALMAFADKSLFLDPPAAELPALPPPDHAAQARMVTLTVDYVTKTVHLLPNFFATRVTTSFEDEPWYAKRHAAGSGPGPADTLTSDEPLRPVGRFTANVLYRQGAEVVQAATDQSGPQGLTTSGEFGPILGTVLLDAAQGNLAWSHWEQQDGQPRAVFRFAVPAAKSHYDVSYCCIVRGYGNPRFTFHRLTGYAGEITVDPATGAVLRVSLKAEDLVRTDPMVRADIVVEYGPVELGGKTYVCPVKAVALSVALEVQSSTGLRTDNDPVQTLLNDVAFEQYHTFHGSARILPGLKPTEEQQGPAGPQP